MLNKHSLLYRLILLFHYIFIWLVFQIFLYSYLYDHLYDILLLKVASLLFWFAIATTCFLLCSSVLFGCFWKAFPNGGYVNLACSIICFWSEGNISLLVRYSYLSIFPDDNGDSFAVSLLVSYCSFFISNLIIDFHD